MMSDNHLIINLKNLKNINMIMLWDRVEMMINI